MGKPRILKIAAVLLAAGLVAVAAPQTAEAFMQSVGSTYTNSVGIPKTAKRGQTIQFRAWFIQHSKDTLIPLQHQVVIWNPALRTGKRDHAYGATVTWLNPITHRWQRSDYSASGGNQQWFFLPDNKALRLRPGVWGHVDIRITFSSKAHTGTWYIDPLPIDGQRLLTRSGKVDDNFLTYRQSRPHWTLTLR